MRAPIAAATMLVVAFPASAQAPAASSDRWQRIAAMPRAGTPERRALDAAWAARSVDAEALMRRIAGPLPLPPEARLLPCASGIDTLVFTLDRAPSIAYLFRLYAMEEEAGRPVHPRDAARENPRPAARAFEQMREVAAGSGRPQAALKARLRQDFEAAGYVREGEAWPAFAYRRPQPAIGRTLDVRVAMQAWEEQRRCARAGVAVGAGPVIRLSYTAKAPLSSLAAMEALGDRLEAEWRQAEKENSAAVKVD